MKEIHKAATDYSQSGLSVIPTYEDKRPACKWKVFTERRMSDREITASFGSAKGIGVVCGKVSGNLELLDFDDHGSAFDAWYKKVPEFIRIRLVVEQSPSGGKHVYYRVDKPIVEGNRKLALKKDNGVLIETRGEGGYVKCAPSEGYKPISGSLTKIGVLSAFERNLLIDFATELDKSGKIGKSETVSANSRGNWEISERGTVSLYDQQRLKDALERAGWKLVRDGANQHWERPGKNEGATSATFNGEVFYVFSSNATPFEPNRGYAVTSVLKLLEKGKLAPMAPIAETKARCGVEVVSQDEVEVVDEGGKDSSPVDPGPVPEQFLHIPGLVDMIAEHTMATAPYPNRTLAFVGALAMVAHLSGRNFRDGMNLRTNHYLIALADSGVGKDHPRKVNINLAARLGIMPTMADRFASGEGLEDALFLYPTSMFQVDEVDTLFAALKDKKDTASERIYASLLQLFTSSDTVYTMRKKALQLGGKTSKQDEIRARGIREPHLTLFGCAIPKYFYAALTERTIENGLLSRCLVFEAGARGEAGDAGMMEFSPKLVEQAGKLVKRGGFDRVNLDNVEVGYDGADLNPKLYTVTETADAVEYRKEIAVKCNALYNASESQAEKALWSRGAEKASRLALVYSISENVDEPMITRDGLEVSWRLVEHITKMMIYQASISVNDSEFGGLMQKALQYLLKCGGKLAHGMLLKKLHISADKFRTVVDTLVQRGEIREIEVGNHGVAYSLR